MRNLNGAHFRQSGFGRVRLRGENCGFAVFCGEAKVRNFKFNLRLIRGLNFPIKSIGEIFSFGGSRLRNRFFASKAPALKSRRNGRVFFKLSKAHEELGLFEKEKEKNTKIENINKNIKNPQFDFNQKIKLPKLPTNEESKKIETIKDDDKGYNIKQFEETIISKIENLLSKKLDGLDEVVVELIRTKTEINMLRSKLDELEAKNYNLLNELSSYKSIGFGLYIKTKEDIKN